MTRAPVAPKPHEAPAASSAKPKRTRLCLRHVLLPSAAKCQALLCQMLPSAGYGAHTHTQMVTITITLPYRHPPGSSVRNQTPWSPGISEMAPMSHIAFSEVFLHGCWFEFGFWWVVFRALMGSQAGFENLYSRPPPKKIDAKCNEPSAE